MKTAPYTLLIASALLFAGCAESGNEGTTTTTVTTPAPSVNQGQTLALNPPHGEPNHNCALPVGAPLDGTPLPRLVKPDLSPIPAKMQVASGMNPPHGELGHDCSIAVGAPLGKK